MQSRPERPLGVQLSRVLRTVGNPDSAEQTGGQAVSLCIGALGVNARICRQCAIDP